MISFKDKTVFVLAPHTDDGELGCGGTISRILEDGGKVYYIAFSTADKSVPPEFPRNQLEIEVKHATSKLGISNDQLIVYKYEVRKLNYVRQEILQQLVDLKKSHSPDLIFLPSSKDIHQDHITVTQEGIRAFKHSTILGYELIWNNLTFNTDCFIKLEKRHIDKKIEALQEYKTQEGRDYMNGRFIESLAHTRGVQIGVEYAETFEVIRWIF